MRDSRICLPLALVGIDVVKTTENLEGGIALDAVVCAEVRLFCAVNLHQCDILLLECGCRLLVLRGERLAVAARDNTRSARS
jgi:hypothetical protein